MLNRPRSSFPTTRRIRASKFSARSSGGMSRVPIAAWNVRLSRLRTRTVFRIAVIRFVGSAVGGTGRGIFPRGPRTTPSRFPITGINGASATKKSPDCARARAFLLSVAYSSISCGWMTKSATFLAFRASSPEANTQMRIGLPRPFGRTTSSSTRFFGTDKSISRRFTASSTDSLNCRGFAASRSFRMVSTECLSATEHRHLQSARPIQPPAKGRRRKGVGLIRFLGPNQKAALAVRRFAFQSDRRQSGIVVARCSWHQSAPGESPHQGFRNDELGRAPGIDVLADPEIACNTGEHVGLVPGEIRAAGEELDPVVGREFCRLVQGRSARQCHPRVGRLDEGSINSESPEDIDPRANGPRDFNSRHANLAVGHQRVDVSNGKLGARLEHGKIYGISLRDLLRVQVPAVIPRVEGRPLLRCGRDPNRPDVRSHRESDSLREDRDAVLDRDHLGPRSVDFVAQDTVTGDDRLETPLGHTDTPNLDSNDIPRTGSDHPDRSGGPVDSVHVQLIEGVLLRPNLTPTRILTHELDGLSRSDLCDRSQIGSEGVRDAVLERNPPHRSRLTR